ncbi:hypothetical protein C8J56DRAFT_118172 [Mycena floridula]|nr:hypothetical protein C8J56DRAFT_118172 [Mycena floridula]
MALSSKNMYTLSLRLKFFTMKHYSYTITSKPNVPKRRRLAGSCDRCKQKRTRCDSGKMPGGICSNCLANGIECKGKARTRSMLGPVFEIQDCPDISIFEDHRDTRSLAARILSPKTPYTISNDYSTIRSTMIELSSYIMTLENELVNIYHSEHRHPQDFQTYTYSHQQCTPQKETVMNICSYSCMSEQDIQSWAYWDNEWSPSSGL